MTTTSTRTAGRRHGRLIAALLACAALVLTLTSTLGTASATPGVQTGALSAKVTKKPGDKVILKGGDRGRKVRDLKARLVQLKLLELPFNEVYDRRTWKAVHTFQTRRHIKVSGRLDKRTWERIAKNTRTPTKKERAGKAPKPPKPPRVPGSYTQKLGRLDSRCTTGLALCIDKRTRTMQWVVNGTPKLGLDVRFGGSSTPTREGQFSVYRKSRDHVSSIYHTPMPFAMFFSGGQAVHFSSDFAAKGYNGASHGCVNVRDYNAIRGLFDAVPIGTKVIVYWS